MESSVLEEKRPLETVIYQIQEGIEKNMRSRYMAQPPTIYIG